MMTPSLFLLLLPLLTEGKQQFFTQQPSDLTVTAGQKAILPCRVENKEGQLQWTRDGFGLGVDRSLPGYPAYTMEGKEPLTQWDLEINPVNLGDDAVYQCQVGAGASSQPIRSSPVRLTVLVPPGEPVITQGPTVDMKEGQEVLLECTSRGGRPAGQISWQDQGGQVIHTNTNTSVHRLEDGKTFSTVSVLRLVPSLQDQNREVVCSVSSHISPTPVQTTTTLRLLFKPMVELNMQGTSLLREGARLAVDCEVEAQPPVSSFSWFLNSEKVETSTSRTFLMDRLDRDHQGALLECEAVNSEGSSRASTRLSLTYGPVMVVQPRSVQVEEGRKVTFSCQATGNPPPRYIWTRQGSDQPLGYSKNLSLVASLGTSGTYSCQATVLSFPAIQSRTASLQLLTRPIIKADKVQFGKVGGAIRLQCMADSGGENTVVTWDRQGVTILDQDKAFDLVEQDLIIRKAEEEDFIANYGCRVANPLGEDYLVITLKKQEVNDTNPGNLVLYVVIAAFSLVTLLLLATLLVVLYQRRRKSNLKYLEGGKQGNNKRINKKYADYEESSRKSSLISSEGGKIMDCSEPDLIPPNRNNFDTRGQSSEPEENNSLTNYEQEYDYEGDQYSFRNNFGNRLHNPHMVEYRDIQPVSPRPHKPFSLRPDDRLRRGLLQDPVATPEYRPVSKTTAFFSKPVPDSPVDSCYHSPSLTMNRSCNSSQLSPSGDSFQELSPPLDLLPGHGFAGTATNMADYNDTSIVEKIKQIPKIEGEEQFLTLLPAA